MKGDWDKAVVLGQTLYNKTLLPENEINTIYIFPRLRYLSLKLVYLKLVNATSLLLEDYVYYLIDYAKTQYTSLTYVERRILFYNLGDVFLMANVDRQYHEQLKAIFENEFALFPEGLLHKPLTKVLPYFEPNGLLQHRPAK
jgi:hypothetical protein